MLQICLLTLLTKIINLTKISEFTVKVASGYERIYQILYLYDKWLAIHCM